MKEKDLSTLTYEELLALAIQAEEEACERYGELADQMEAHHNPDAAEFFQRMRTREFKHLEHLKTLRTSASSLRSLIQPLQFFDPLEALPYEVAHYKMTPTHVLEASQKAELRASAFYKDLTERLSDTKARDLAHSLWEEERTHVKEIEQALRHLPPIPEDWENDHDEPVSQD